MIINNDKTINHPAIIKFKQACDNAAAGNPLTINMVQSRDLFKYSKSLMIAEFDKEQNDFKFRFCGSNIASNYEMDITGKYISETTDPSTIKEFIKIYKSIIDDQKTVYFTGTLQTRGKDFLDWHQISQPLMRNGRINEVISYVIVEGRVND
ncbi:hypothetical protein [Pseudemcibacter aquimaris]|uniref:hypothetical protein n=1 Tax=Pseudemcibacter aquimaris TaxID=2857064 RepID=UPI002011FB73|nr:hypothetical protein [Pseudemcibacter aquimaris]MCC3862573.1 hypothetical protein [Pseudemcibacter aquimaris]WDU57909.1 hypothetical protein KW060_11970 [Pseudemcibacter aquimaris]